MPRRFFRRFIPHPRSSRWLRAIEHRPDLWHLNRHSVARAFAVGAFWGFIPMPLQTVPTILFAILFRANVALAFGITWIVNPGFFPTLYACYTVGRLVLGWPQIKMPEHWTWGWLWSNLGNMGAPLYLGSLILGSFASLFSYFAMQFLWRYFVMRRWRKRCARRACERRDAEAQRMN